MCNRSSQKANERLFAVAGQPSRSELAEWATKGEMFLAQHAIDTGVYEDALKRLLRLYTPDASFTLAHVCYFAVIIICILCFSFSCK
jgi:hypothetical protein